MFYDNGLCTRRNLPRNLPTHAPHSLTIPNRRGLGGMQQGSGFHQFRSSWTLDSGFESSPDSQRSVTGNPSANRDDDSMIGDNRPSRAGTEKTLSLT